MGVEGFAISKKKVEQQGDKFSSTHNEHLQPLVEAAVPALMRVRQGRKGAVRWAPCVPHITVSTTNAILDVQWECQVAVWKTDRAVRPEPEEVPTIDDILPALPSSLLKLVRRTIETSVGERRPLEGSLLTTVRYGHHFWCIIPQPEANLLGDSDKLMAALRGWRVTQESRKVRAQSLPPGLSGEPGVGECPLPHRF